MFGHFSNWKKEERRQRVLRQAKCRSWPRGKPGVGFLMRSVGDSHQVEMESGTYSQWSITWPLKGIHLNEFLMRWVKLEPIIQSEVSQKEKHQYSILMHIYGI